MSSLFRLSPSFLPLFLLVVLWAPASASESQTESKIQRGAQLQLASRCRRGADLTRLRIQNRATSVSVKDRAVGQAKISVIQNVEKVSADFEESRLRNLRTLHD